MLRLKRKPSAFSQLVLRIQVAGFQLEEDADGTQWILHDNVVVAYIPSREGLSINYIVEEKSTLAIETLLRIGEELRSTGLRISSGATPADWERKITQQRETQPPPPL